MKLLELFRNPFFGYKKTIGEIRKIQNHYTKLSIETLRNDFVEIQNYISEQIEKNPNQDILTKELTKVFAIVIEILNRSSVTITDSQIAGAIALHQGNIFEFSQNSDHAYSIILAAILNSLTKQGVHIVLINETLTKRYYEKFKSLLSFLEISAEVTCEYEENTEKLYKIYDADILFGELFQYCFDCIRTDNIDNTSSIKREFVIIDHADIVLLDKAFTTAQLNKSVNDVSNHAAIITPYVFVKQYKKMAGISCIASNNRDDYQNLYALKVCNFDSDKETKQIPSKNLVYKTRREKFYGIAEYIKRAISENRYVIVDVRDHLIANPSGREGEVSQYELFKALLKSLNIEHVIAEDNLNHIEKGKAFITNNIEHLLTSNNDAAIFSSDLVLLVLEKYPNHNINLCLRKHLRHAAIYFFLSTEDEAISGYAEKMRHIMDQFGFAEGEAVDIPVMSKNIDKIIVKMQNIRSGYYQYMQSYNDILQDQYIKLKARREELLSQYITFPGNPEIEVRMNKIRAQAFPIIEQVKGEEYEDILIPVSMGEKTIEIGVNIREFLDSDGYVIFEELHHQIFEYTIREHWEEQLMKFFNLHYAYERAIKERQPQFKDFVPLSDYDSLINSIYIAAENRLSNSSIPL